MHAIDIVCTVLVVLIIVLIWIMLLDSNRFVIRHTSIANARIQKPVKLVMISDLHNKSYGRDNVQLLDAIKKEEPDIILCAGDVITAHPKANLTIAEQFVSSLTEIAPVCYANGNHEYRIKLYPETYGDMAKRYAEILKAAGIEPLVNDRCSFEELNLNIYGVEIDKEYYNRFRKKFLEPVYLKRLLGEPAQDTCNILLAHNPEYFPAYAEWGADIVLSGHVHGGVARVPFWGKGVISPSFRLFPKYDGGIFESGKATMILSRGLGSHTIPVRLFNPGELWTITLQPEEKSNSGDAADAMASDAEKECEGITATASEREQS